MAYAAEVASVEFVGCTTPYAEAVIGALQRHEIVAELEGSSRRITFIRCAEDEHWNHVSDLAAEPGHLVIAVLPEMLAANYRRAIVENAAGVIHDELGSAEVADVARATTRGEILLPLEAVRAMASGSGRSKTATTAITDEEVLLLRELAAGVTVVDIAKRHYYNERTIRRRLQNLYLKLGAANRDAAIAAASQLGLLDND